ncbi:MAG: glycosyltransferase family 1 protein [Planctomycetota bacterium]|nr:MAG: glycosyltransferase family 1 protein [Planctomycetota bacterium]
MSEASFGPAPARPVRLTVVSTHPIQYYTPLFRCLAQARRHLRLDVLYITRPTPAQQGIGYGVPFVWDLPLLEGHPQRILRPPLGSDDFGRFFGLRARGLRAAIVETDPDVVLVPGWEYFASLQALLACRALGLPVLYRGDTSLLQAPKPYRLRHVAWVVRTHALLRLYSAYLAVGRHARRYLERFGVSERNVFRSPHCVDVDFFRTASSPLRRPEQRGCLRRSFGCGNEDFVVLFAGKIVPEKRLDLLIEALAGLGPRTRLLVAGTGTAEERCRRLAEVHGVRASWLGFRNQGKLPEVYAAADVLCLPSERETWGLVVNEALACGTPCVVSDGVGCAPDLIETPWTGEVFRRGDVRALREALLRIRDRRRRGVDYSTACLRMAASHSPLAASRGIVAACRHVTGL